MTGRSRGEEPARSAYLRELRRGRRRQGTGAPDADADGRRRSQWPVLAVAVLPGLAALVALLFTWREVRVAEQGQLTARFNDAITNLGSESLDVRFGGIYALERIMQDSPRDQPRIVLVLSAYVRRHASVPATGFVKEPTEQQPGQAAPADRRPPTDVMAVVNVLARRSPGHDGDTQIDWNRADLRGLSLSTWSFKDIAKVPEGGALPDERAPFGYVNVEGADLRHATLSGVDLRSAFVGEANLSGAQLLRSDLRDADLTGADLSDANVVDTNLTGADLSGALLRGTSLARPDVLVRLNPNDLSRALLWDADLTGADLTGANLTEAVLVDADLTGASLVTARLRGAKFSSMDTSLQARIVSGTVTESANLTDADLSGADLRGADLRKADLTRATLNGADLTDADLRGARLTGATFDGAKTDGAKTDGARGLPT
ncbi:pentapeptide repeat-containing protein [Streptomyces sp. NPDC056056]|uniref:pentapeptide repeat-containing protein n=1 Tax=Streptomyces sp. NPDC056056 TaxID=3345698 RepID=UPI0035D672A4